MFHSGHLSHLLKLSGQPYRRQKTLTTGDLFLAKSFSDTDHTIRCARRRSSSFLKAPEGDSHPRAAQRVSSPAAWISRAGAWGRVEHFPATHFHLQPRLTPSSHPSSVLVPSKPWKCIFWGFFVSADPLNSLSGNLRWLPLHPKPYMCLRKCSSTLPIVPHLFFFTIWSLTISDPRFFFFQPRSEAVLGLSSIQTYFVLQISRYNY